MPYRVVETEVLAPPAALVPDCPVLPLPPSATWGESLQQLQKHRDALRECSAAAEELRDWLESHDAL